MAAEADPIRRERRFDGRFPWVLFLLTRAVRNPRTLETISVTWFSAAASAAAVLYVRFADLPFGVSGLETLLVIGAVGASIPGLALRALSPRRPLEHDLGLPPATHIALITVVAVALGAPASAVTVATAVIVGVPPGPLVVIHALAVLIAVSVGILLPPHLGDGSSEATYTAVHLVVTGMIGSLVVGRLGSPASLLLAASALVVAAAVLFQVTTVVESARRVPLSPDPDHLRIPRGMEGSTP